MYCSFAAALIHVLDKFPFFRVDFHQPSFRAIPLRRRLCRADAGRTRTSRDSGGATAEQQADLHVLQQAVDDSIEAPIEERPESKAILALAALDTLPMVSVYAAEAIAGNDDERFAAEKLWQSRRLLEYFEGQCRR